jgi:hypothetical protein
MDGEKQGEFSVLVSLNEVRVLLPAECGYMLAFEP